MKSGCYDDDTDSGLENVVQKKHMTFHTKIYKAKYGYKNAISFNYVNHDLMLCV